MQDAAHDIPGDTVALAIRFKRVRFGIKFVQPILRAHPQCSGPIKVDRVHPVVTQARGVIRIVVIDGEMLGKVIESVQSHIAAKPHVPIAVFGDRVIIEASTFRVWFVRSKTLGRRIEMTEAVPRCTPECSVTIDQQSLNYAATYGRRISRDSIVRAKLSCLPIVSLKPLTCSKPKCVRSRFDDAQHLGSTDQFEGGILS